MPYHCYMPFIYLAVSGIERFNPKEEWDVKKMWDVEPASHHVSVYRMIERMTFKIRRSFPLSASLSRLDISFVISWSDFF